MKPEFVLLPTSFSGLGPFSSLLLGVAKWWLEAGQPMWPPEQLGPAWLLEAYPDGHFFLVLVDDEPAAAFVLIKHDPVFWPDVQRGESLFIHKVGVAQSFRGQGLLGKILDFSKTQVLGQHRRFLRLDTDASRPKVCALYETQGFVRVGDVFAFNRFCALYEWASGQA